MTEYNTRYNSSLDRYDIQETSPGEVIMSKRGETFVLELTVDVGIMYAKLTGKNVTIETKTDMPYLKITPTTTADEAIAQYYKNDANDSSEIYRREVMQYYLQDPTRWIK